MDQLGERFQDALTYAARVHADDRRKGGEIPYIAHLLSVCGMTIENGGDEDEAVGALLHDAAEDHGGEPRLRDIAERFGESVAQIVRDCSDSLTEDPERKAPWEERKPAYVRHLGDGACEGAVLVSLADKVHNARAIARDIEMRGPDAVWERFSRSRPLELGYYYALLDAYSRRIEPGDRKAMLLIEYERAVRALGRRDEATPLLA